MSIEWGVQSWVVNPDYSSLTQSGSSYPIGIDRALAAASRVSKWFAPHQVYFGSPNPDLAIELEAGYVWDGTTKTEMSRQTVAGFTVPSAGQHRIDRVVVDASTGVASRVAGTAVTGSPSAVAPAVSVGQIPICQVLVTAGDTAILNSMIADERSFMTTAGGVPTGVMLDYASNGSGSPDSVPVGYLLCNGANVSRLTYSGLFSVIGTTWGVGDGVNTFGLPDSRRRVSVGSGGTPTATLGSGVGAIGGAETKTLATVELPSHSHQIALRGDPGSGNTMPSDSNAGAQSATGTTAASGSGTAFSLMQPSFVVQKMIKT